MFYKYYLEPNSIIYKSLLLGLFEPKEYAYHIEGLDYDLSHKLFSINKIKYFKDEIVLSSLPSSIEVIYLEEKTLELKAIVLKYNKEYYLFRVDHQNRFQLNIHQKYISSDLEALCLDYESHSKSKGKVLYKGIGDFSDIKDIDYFEYLYEKEVAKQIDKTSNIYRLKFTRNNSFTVDFVYLVKNKIINISNFESLDPKVLTLTTMNKQHEHRHDCLLINSETKEIEYFIFTYKPHLINHYYLFKYLGNDTFMYLLEDISFNKVLSSIKDKKYKKGSKFASLEFSKMRYDNFSSEYVAFEEEEEFEVNAINELELTNTTLEITEEQKIEMLLDVSNLLKQRKFTYEAGLTLHGKSRILERLGEMSESEMMDLANVAYEYGKNPVHYLEKDITMFKFLRYQQGKQGNKEIRFYHNVLFFYSMTPPHVLVTVFHYKNNYEEFLKHLK